jgi:L-ascorbate metabolism protein UlaG (beta-lactamase superfamily)
MIITKYVHACLLVEMPDRTALFDPGIMSEEALDVSKLAQLQDIFITHEHTDHISLQLMKELVEKFPEVRITSTQPVVQLLSREGIKASMVAPEGAELFNSPHEAVEPLFPTPEEIGVHYQNVLSHPGDSHSFQETKAILALPVTGPWASTIRALTLAIALKPRYVLPIHDWHWSEQARTQLYARMESVLSKEGITFMKLENGVPVTVEI